MYLRLFPLLCLVLAQASFYDIDPFLECPDPDLSAACTQRCESQALECILDCSNGDATCISNCLRNETECIEDCPCERNCLEGCDDCQNPVCECKNVKENVQWNDCTDTNGIAVSRCLYDCKDNKDCEDQCVAMFKIRQQDCPCEINCAAGCPCENFNCLDTSTTTDIATITTTTPATSTTMTTSTTSVSSNAVLVLSNWNSENKPMVVDFEGRVNDDLNFNYENGLDIIQGCGVTIKGQFWYLGNARSKRQAAKIVGCKMVRQSDLPFNFDRGSCNTFEMPEEKVLMCFSYNSNKNCHMFDGENFETAASSKCEHGLTFGLANYRGLALTAGSFSNSDCYNKAETYNFLTNRWSDAPNYPFSSKIYYYSVASTSEAAFVIGGNDGSSYSNVIAQYKNDEWSLYGNLKKARSVHGSITSISETMIVGGWINDSSAAETEIWNFTNSDNRIIDPTLPANKYAVGIGLYLVPVDFCSKLQINSFLCLGIK